MSARDSSASLAVAMLTLMAGVVVAYGVTAPVPASASAEDAAPVTTVTTVAPPASSRRRRRPPSPSRPRPNRRRGPSWRSSGTRWPTRWPRSSTAGCGPSAPSRSSTWHPGRRIPTWGLDGQITPGLDVAQSLRPLQPDVWVVQLGTNDVAYEPLDQSRYAFWIIALLEAAGPDAPVVWVNVHRADRPAEAAAFDAVLALLDAERPQLRVADWAAVAATEPVLAPDGVHLAPEGGGRFAGVIADAVAAALG